MQPDAALAGDACQAADRVNAARIDITRTRNDGHLLTPGARVLVEPALQGIDVDRAFAIERDFAQAASAQA
jgi:hypothetical protein